MKTWSERAKEEAYLLNPPFCCVILSAVCCGYKQKCNRDFPFILTFLVLPIILHKYTRNSLPKTTKSLIINWMQGNTEIKIGFYERLMAMKPYSREALRFGIQMQWISLNDCGEIVCNKSVSQIENAENLLEAEAKECVSTAFFLGKWFGSTTSTETIMTVWGIKP